MTYRVQYANMSVSEKQPLGIPVIVSLDFGAMLPSWLTNYLKHLSDKHDDPNARHQHRLGMQALIAKEGSAVPFILLFGHDDRRNILFRTEQDYVMFLLKWA